MSEFEEYKRSASDDLSIFYNVTVANFTVSNERRREVVDAINKPLSVISCETCAQSTKGMFTVQYQKQNGKDCTMDYH